MGFRLVPRTRLCTAVLYHDLHVQGPLENPALHTQDVILVRGAWEVYSCREVKSCRVSEDNTLRGSDEDAGKAIEWQTLAAFGLVHVFDSSDLAMIPPPNTM